MAKKRKSQPALSSFTDLQARARLREARELLEVDDDAGAADMRLHSVCRALVLPASRQVLTEAIDLAADLHDYQLLEWAATAYLARWPDSPALTMMAASACVENGHVAAGTVLARRVSERWPNDPAAVDAKVIVEAAERHLGETLGSGGLAPSDIESACLHEKAQNLLAVERYGEAEATARTLLERLPTFAPGHNNLCLTVWAQGKVSEALGICERTLSLQPDNVHALSNRVRCLMSLGQTDAAREATVPLRASTRAATDRRLKMMEALALVGDHQGVLELFDGSGSPVERHFAAAAAASLGDVARARDLWRTTSADEGLEWARDNLEDLDLEEGERHGPWYFPMGWLVPPQPLHALREGATAAAGAADVLRRAVVTAPALPPMVPLALGIGCPDAVNVALAIADASRDERSLASVNAFVTGRRGADALRFEALNVLGRAGVVKQGEVVEMFVRGKPQPVKLVSFEVYEQPEGRHQGEVSNLYREGLEAMREGDASEAEACFRDALALSPGAPDLTQNLAAALEHQGRQEEAFRLLDELHRRDPEYLFARCGVAHLTALRGNADEADRLLAPVHQVSRLHVSELVSYARARAAIANARGNRPLAAHWSHLAAQGRLGTVFHASPVAP